MQRLVDFSYSGSESVYLPFSEDFKDSMERYLVQGLGPGGFATAMLATDMERALYNADTHNRTVYWAIAMWIRERCPPGSWGSYEAVDNWCADRDSVRTKWLTWRMLQDKEAHDEVY